MTYQEKVHYWTQVMCRAKWSYSIDPDLSREICRVARQAIDELKHDAADFHGVQSVIVDVDDEWLSALSE